MYQLSDIQVWHGDKKALDVTQLSIAADELTVILGHNGSGKSTLLKLLARQNQPTQGSISWNNQPLNQFSTKALAQQIAFLPQQLPEAAGLSVKELVGLGRYPWRGLLGRWRGSDHQAVMEALEQTRIGHYQDTLADQLSGGERQRAWIAMLLAQQSPLLLLDEPTSALDLAHQYQLMTLLRELNQKQQRGIVAILHDVNLAARYADRIIALRHGEICFDGSPQQLLNAKTLSDIYGVELQLVEQPNQPLPVAVVA